MIEFDSHKKLFLFLKENLPPKVKKELLYRKVKHEYRGHEVENLYKKEYFIVYEILRNNGFAFGLSTDKDSLQFPDRIFLLWSKMKKYLDKTDTLPYEYQQSALLSINNACRFLDVTRPTLYKLIKTGDISYVEVLSQKRIQLADLLSFIEKNKKYKKL